MKEKMIYIYRKGKREKERKKSTHQVKLDKTGAFVGKTHKKIRKQVRNSA